MLNKLIAEINNSTFSVLKQGSEGDPASFKTLWRKVFDQSNLRVQQRFLRGLTIGFNFTDEMFSEILGDLLNHPNPSSRFFIANFIGIKPYLLPGGDKFNQTIEAALSDSDQRVRFAALSALEPFIFSKSKDWNIVLPKNLEKKGLEVFGEMLEHKNLRRFDFVVPLHVFGPKAAIYANQIGEIILGEKYKYSELLTRYLFNVGAEFHHFFPLVRNILAKDQHQHLVKGILSAVRSVATCRPVYCPKIKELVPDLRKFEKKYGHDLGYLFKIIEEGPYTDEVFV